MILLRQAQHDCQRDAFGTPFPLILECESATPSLGQVETWVAGNAAELLARVAEAGVILLRGFPLKNDADFDRFVAAFGWTNFPYKESLSNAVRVNRTERVFTANEAPASVTIPLHHEMAQTPRYPSHLFFFCEQASETGGATSVCRSDLLWEKLLEAAPEFAQACADKGLRYSHTMPEVDDPASGLGRSWGSTLNSNTREEAEARLRTLDYSWDWEDDGALHVTTPTLPAVLALTNGRTAFFNQLLAATRGWKDTRNDPSKTLVHGDGSALDLAGIEALATLAEALTVDVPWQSGDVALVDNLVAMHGRRHFTGTRKVLASLVG